MSLLHTISEAVYSFARSLGGPGLFLIALADSSFLSLPEGNDVLIVILSTGQSWELMSYYAVMTVLGSVTGCSLLYWVGRRGGGFIGRRMSPRKMERVRASYQRWGVWAVLVPSILPPPTPFKVFVLSAGVFQLSFPKFLAAVFLGRSFRYFMWGILAVLYGELAKQFLENNIHTVGLILALVMVIGVVVYFLLRRRTAEVDSQPVI